MADYQVTTNTSSDATRLEFSDRFNAAVPFIDRHLEDGRASKVAIRVHGGVFWVPGLFMILGAASASAQEGIWENPNALLVQVATPILRDWIIQSRDEAVAHGVQIIPPEVRSALSGYVPEDILDRVRWRVGGGDQLSLQRNSFYFADTPAITLDHVVVFRQQAAAFNDLELWVHELRHVIQFRDWGIEQFAARYLMDYDEIESDASRYRWEWVFR